MKGDFVKYHLPFHPEEYIIDRVEFIRDRYELISLLTEGGRTLSVIYLRQGFGPRATHLTVSKRPFAPLAHRPLASGPMPWLFNSNGAIRCRTTLTGAGDAAADALLIAPPPKTWVRS
jgi:hypothetical protein